MKYLPTFSLRARRVAAAFAASLLVATLPMTVGAQAARWPAKPITWLVGWPPGGSADSVTRLVAKRLEEKLGQPVVVDNRPGASGSIALNAAARANADGTTLVTIPGPVLTALPTPAMGKAFTGVAELAKGPMVFVGPAANAFPTLQDLLADVRKRPSAYSFASSGNGTSQHLGGELLNQLAHTSMQHIPYKGGTQAVTDVLGGTVPLAMLGITPVLPHVKAGKLKAYAVSTAMRSPALPDVPTFQEAGVKGFEASQWFVVATPVGTPTDRIARLNAAINEVLALPEIAAGFAGVGVQPSPASPAETTNYVVQDQARWTELARKANLPLD